MFKPRFEFSWRAAFIGCYVTPERDRVWLCLIPFFPLYIRLRPTPPGEAN